ncbi:MAG: FkbM family methyltransferase, partial [Pseudolabrys sp.]
PKFSLSNLRPETSRVFSLIFNPNPGMPIRAIQTALSDAPAELVVVRPGKDRGSARVRSAAAAPEKGAQRIQAQTLLQLLQSERIDRLDAIKIDVDGCEDRILVPFFRSARRLLWPRLL